MGSVQFVVELRNLAEQIISLFDERLIAGGYRATVLAPA
jgi:hypothetical protein